MRNDDFGMIDRFFWEISTIFLRTWYGRLILFCVFVIFSSPFFFFRQTSLWLAIVAIIIVFALWLFSLNRLSGFLSDWFIRGLEIPSKNPFTVKSLTVKFGLFLVILTALAGYFLSLNGAILTGAVVLFFYFLILMAYYFETDFGKINLNTVFGRFGEIALIGDDGLLTLRSGRKLRIGVLAGNLGGAREPQMLPVFHQAFTEILQMLALVKARVGSAFSIIEFANRSPILASEIVGLGEIQRAVAAQTKAMRQTTYQQVVLIILEAEVFQKVALAFEQKAEMRLSALSRLAVLAYLQQTFTRQQTLFSIRRADLAGKELADWPQFLPQKVVIAGEMAVFDDQMATAVIQVFPQTAEDLVFLQNLARQRNLQLKLIGAPSAHLFDEIALRHKSKDWGSGSPSAKILYGETFASRDSRVLLRIVVDLIISAKTKDDCQKRLTAALQALSQMEHRVLSDSALSRAMESFAFLPIVPQRRIFGFWESLELVGLFHDFVAKRLNQVLPWQQISSGKISPYLTAIREEGATDDLNLKPSRLSALMGYGVEVGKRRPFFYSLDALQQGEAVFRLIFGAVGSGKTILERSIAARLCGVIPQFGIVLKAGDPEWSKLVEALAGRVLLDPMLDSLDGHDAGEFRQMVQESLSLCFSHNSILLYQANSASLQPAHEIGLLIFLQELVFSQNANLRQRGTKEQKASALFVDEAALVAAAWGTLNEYAKKSVDLLAGIFRNARDWRMAISLIFQSLADVYGNTDVRNPLVVVLRGQQVPFEQSAAKFIFSGGALEEDLKRAGFPGFKCEDPTTDNVIGLILTTSYRIGTFWLIRPRRGSHNLIHLPLTDAEQQFVPLRVLTAKGDGRIIS